ncbi:MAG: helix-turn-helix domain-containing protein [Lachnospiraceae bacterium]
MDLEYYKYLCRSLAKATGAGIRLYRGEELLYYYSVYHIHPDPVMPFLKSILSSPHRAGVCATPLYQFYGYLSLPEDCLIIIGPTRIINDDKRLIENLLFLLEIPSDKRQEYERLLFCAPVITAERMSWMLSYLMSSSTNHIFPVENVFLDTQTKDYGAEVQKASLHHTLNSENDEVAKGTVQNSYHMEQLLLSYIREGQHQKLAELFSATPSIAEGTMAQDSLRQKKNAGICCAAISSRAAIDGGMDSQSAFRLSDLYIQKFELIRDIKSAEKLTWEMMIDYAKRVQQIKYNTKEDSVLFQKCAAYISRNIYRNIRTEELAAETGYARTYLCSQFKKQTGISLSQYILQEKVIEAQRMLQFTDKSLSEIAAQFSFSSQSHFQTVFKKLTGETPLAFRKRVQKQKA